MSSIQALNSWECYR